MIISCVMESSLRDRYDETVSFSRKKLNVVAESLAPWISNCRQLACTSREQTEGYRCRCSFQCVWTDENKMHYAIRRQQEPVLLTGAFGVANVRIQEAMSGLSALLSSEDATVLRQNLTSITFSSSWRDIQDNASIPEDSDCLVTLHYDAAIQDQSAWKDEAAQACADLSLDQITGRSRKRIIRALDTTGVPVIRDTLWLTFDRKNWFVSCRNDKQNDGGDAATTTTRIVRYEKPEGTFFHPNGAAMCQALEWMLSRVSTICLENKKRKARLLEMYSGCGAHTVALLQTDLFEKIVAIELDERLVKACRRNYELNRESGGNVTTDVEVFSADAAGWARNSLSDEESSFDILLVDPPRQGLSEAVCQMACDGSFRHFLYISCGREALVRDLGRLKYHFEVVDCTLLDLFPQTDAVESLVHLQRRK